VIHAMAPLTLDVAVLDGVAARTGLELSFIPGLATGGAVARHSGSGALSLYIRSGCKK